MHESIITWYDSDLDLPAPVDIVLVSGGIAQYRDGQWYTGMEEPQFTRPIQWPVEYWAHMPEPFPLNT